MMQQLSLTAVNHSSQDSQSVEIVERKGIGHPDTVCDALAEELSRALSRYYLEQFGLVLHHNVDKALLWGGVSQSRFGGGAILQPIEIFHAGRATLEHKGVKVPIEQLVKESSTNWLRSHFHALDPDQHIKLHCLIRPGSADLVELYLRQEQTGIALANDTSCGVGYAPMSELERLVLHVEKQLNASDIKSQYPEYGEDIKLMGVRRNNNIDLTVACAFVDRHVRDVEDYVAKKNRLTELVEGTAKTITDKNVAVMVNAADDIATGSLYLTVTGTSAESGDDGEVGRGNRVNGLITPYRPMNMEAAAGKNPVTHVGKLYNIVAQRIATRLVAELNEIQRANCYLVSRIGSPIHEPQLIDLQVEITDGVVTDRLKSRIDDIVYIQLSDIYSIRDEIIKGDISVY